SLRIHEWEEDQLQKRPWVKVDPTRNVCHHVVLERGDVDQAFARAVRIVEDEFRFPSTYHYSMEPHACIAEVRAGEISIYSSTQAPFRVREEIAYTFGVPEHRIRVVAPMV